MTRISFGDINYTFEDDPRMRPDLVRSELLLSRVVQVEHVVPELDVKEPFWALITEVKNENEFMGQVLATPLFLDYVVGDLVAIDRGDILFTLKKD